MDVYYLKLYTSPLAECLIVCVFFISYSNLFVCESLCFFLHTLVKPVAMSMVCAVIIPI